MKTMTEWIEIEQLPEYILCAYDTSATPFVRFVRERTCKVVSKPCDMWECECGMAWWHAGTPNYCPNCGAKVVDADGQG